MNNPTYFPIISLTLLMKSFAWLNSKTINCKLKTIQEHPYPGKLLCSCDDGVLLLSTTCSTSYLLWNPSSKQQKVIPCPDDWGWGTFRICRDPTLDDFKIVAIDWLYYAVFSCRNKVWTEKKEFSYSRRRGLFDGLCFFHIKEFRGYRCEIVYFDPRDNTFNKVEKPREIKDSENSHTFLTNLRGCLCLCNDTDFGTKFQIWTLMRDHITVDSNSWTKYMIVDKPCIAPWNIMVTPLFLTERNELVLMISSEYKLESEFGIYKSTENGYKKLDTPTSMIPVLRSEMTVPYVESLFFPIG